MPVKTAKKPVKRAPRGITFQDLQKSQNEAWKVIRDSRKETRKHQEDYQKEMKEHREEFKKEMKEHRESQEKANMELRKSLHDSNMELQEALKKSKETLDKSMGELSNKLGSLVEKILIPELPQKFKELGYSFNRLAVYQISEGVYAQIDGMLENGTMAVAVEVKTTLRHRDIEDHLIRMEKIRQYATEQGDTRQFMGAMAATVTSDSSRKYALKQGLFVIEPSGENVKVTKPTRKPKVW